MLTRATIAQLSTIVAVTAGCSTPPAATTTTTSPSNAPTAETRASSVAPSSVNAVVSANPVSAAPPSYLMTIKSDGLRARLEAAGYPGVKVETGAKPGEWTGFEAHTANGKIGLTIMNFGSPYVDDEDLPALIDVNKQRTIVVSSPKATGTAATDKAIFDLVVKSKCDEGHALDKVLKDDGYTITLGEGFKQSTLGIGTNIREVKKGTATAHIVLYEYKAGDRPHAAFVDPPVVVGAAATDDSGTTQAAVDKFIAALR